MDRNVTAPYLEDEAQRNIFVLLSKKETEPEVTPGGITVTHFKGFIAQHVVFLKLKPVLKKQI